VIRIPHQAPPRLTAEGKYWQQPAIARLLFGLPLRRVAELAGREPADVVRVLHGEWGG
jgi:hypothetical protein